MSLFKPKIGSLEQLLSTPVEDGQFIVLTDKKEIYVDFSGERYKVASEPLSEVIANTDSDNGILYTAEDQIKILPLGHNGEFLSVKQDSLCWETAHFTTGAISEKYTVKGDTSLPSTVFLSHEDYILDFANADCGSSASLVFECNGIDNPTNWEIWLHSSNEITELNLHGTIYNIDLPQQFYPVDSLPSVHMLKVRYIPSLNTYQLSFIGSFPEGGCFVYSSENQLLARGTELSNVVVNAGETMKIYSGGVALRPIISAEGRLIVNSGGSAFDVVADDNSDIVVEEGGLLTYYMLPQLISTPDNLTSNTSDPEWKISAEFASGENADAAKAYLMANGDHAHNGSFRLSGFANGDATCAFIWKRNTSPWCVKTVTYGIYRMSVFQQYIHKFQLQGSNNGTDWINIGLVQNLEATPFNSYVERNFDYPENEASFSFHRLLIHEGDTYGEYAYSMMAAGATLVKLTGFA